MTGWLLNLLPLILIHIICYLTNPIVVLFCDEDGELPSFLHYWQTWDDSCDSKFFMTNCVPAFLDYGYDEHYVQYISFDEYTVKYCKNRYFSQHTTDDWTVKQRIQRYCCRVLWLTRNCAYGFAFNFFGADMSNIEWKINEPAKFYGTTDKSFCYKNEQRICSWLRWKVYLGWKTYPNNTEPQHCMYACRAWVSFGG